MITEKKIDSFEDIGKGRVFLELYSPDCAHCRAVEPAVLELSEALCDIDFIKVDTKSCRAAELFGIRSVPTFVMMSGGREVGRLIGAKKAPELRELAMKGL